MSLSVCAMRLGQAGSRIALAYLAASLVLSIASAQITPQGGKLVGTGGIGSPAQGYSVALSSDGSTAIVGGWNDNNQIGAAWVFTRAAGVWSQQSKLVANDSVGAANQGWSVGLSADGNTAIVGGSGDRGETGAAWIYTRSAGAWSQQGPKLVARDATGAAAQGWSVGLSTDGNTAIVGGSADNNYAGAVWIYTRSSGIWSQQGAKLVAADSVGAAFQGYSVALSGDGNTAIEGGIADDSYGGAAWVFTRAGGVWSEQFKLTAGDAVGAAGQGQSVALSNDGNTAMVGGSWDNNYFGAAWIYTRSGTFWSQQGAKLLGSGATANASAGQSVSLSADGNTAILGGGGDSGSLGAAWVFTRASSAWTQRGGKIVGAGSAGASQQGNSVAVSGNGSTAIVGGPADANGTGAVWLYAMPPSGTSFVTTTNFGTARTNFTGWVGMQFTVGSSPLAVSALGRIYVAGNTGTHTVKLVRASDGSDIPGGSTLVSTQSGTSLQYNYASLASPITLLPNTAYFLVSQETLGQDVWYDTDSIATTNAGVANGAVYTSGSAYTTQSSPNFEFGPVNFFYSIGSISLPPAVSVSAPASGATISGKTVTVSATATAATGLTISSVQFYVDSKSLGSAVTGAGPSYSTILDSTTLTNAAHSISAVAFDSAGNSANSTAVTVTVNNSVAQSAPVVTVTAPAAGATVSGKTVAVSATAVPASGTIANVQFYVDNNPLGSPVTAGPTYSTILDSTTLSNGTHALKATALDSTNTSGTSNAVSITVSNTISSPPPTVSVTSPTGGTTLSGPASPVVVSAAAAAGLTIASVQLSFDGQTVGSTVTGAGPTYNLTLNTTTLGNGAHALAAVAIDSAGGTATSAPVTVSISNSNAPIPFITTQTFGAARNNFSGFLGMELTVGSAPVNVTALGRMYQSGNGASHTLKLVNAGTGADVPGASVAVTGGSAGQYTYGPLSSPVTLAANTAYYLVSQESAGGDQFYDVGPVTGSTVAAINGPVYFSGTGYAFVNVPGDSFVPVNFLYSTSASSAPPTVSVNTPAPNAIVSGSTPLSANAAAAAGLTIVSVTFSIDNGAPGAAVTTGNPYQQSFDTTKLTNGVHSVTATATDSAAHSTTSTAVSFSVNNGGGGAPTGSPLLTSAPAGSLRNNYSGFIGLKFTVGSTPITVTALGRVYVSGNTGAHQIKLVKVSDGSNVPGGSVTLSLPSGTAGQFTYVSLPSPIALAANTAYYLVSQEAASGDQWYDITAVTAASGAVVNTGVYQAGPTTFVEVGTANTSYVPVNILFTAGAVNVVLTAPAPGNVSGNSVAVTASVTPPAGVTVTSVQFKLDNANTGAPVSASPYGITLDTTKLVNGPHSLSAVVTDSGGGSTTSAPVSVTVNNPAPTVAVSAPGNNTPVSGTIPLTATATAGAAMTLASVQFKVDGANQGAAITSSPYSTTLDTTKLSGVNHTITAVATDTAGNSTTSAIVNVTLGGGSTQTTVSITAPAPNASVSGSSVGVSATVTPGSGLTIGSVQFKVDNVNYGSPLTTAPYNATLDSTKLTNGGHTLTAVATDSGNNTPSASVSIVVNNAVSGGTTTAFVTGFTPGPARNNFNGFVGMSFTVGSTALNVTSLGRIYLSGNTASHVLKLVLASNGTDVPGGSVTLTPAGTPGQFSYAQLPGAVTLQANTAYYLVSQETANGDQWYDFGPVTTTSAGSVNAFVYSVGPGYTTIPGVYSYVPANLLYSVAAAAGGPTVSLTAPTAGASLSGNNVPLSATATAASGLTIASVQYKVDNGNVGSPVTTGPSYNAVLDATKLGNGSHAITAVATDSNGVSATSAAITVTVNNSTTTVAITAPANNAPVSATIVVSASPTPAPGTSITGVQFKVDNGNVGAPVTASPYQISLDTTTLSNGSHAITAVAADSGGGSATSGAVTVTVANNAAVGGTPFVTGFTPGPARNNFTGLVGMRFTVGSTALSVSSLGRIYLSGNSASHLVKLVRGSDGGDVPGGSVTWTPAGTPGQFSYAQLASAVTLPANTTFYLVSQETLNGDQWYDYSPVATSSAGSVNGFVYSAPGYTSIPGAYSYVPVNFLYSAASGGGPGGTTVSIGAPVNNSSISGPAVILTASPSAGAGLSVASVQFKVDGANLGSPVTTSPYSTTLNTTTLSNAAHTITAVVTDSASATASSSVNVTVNNAVASTTLVTSYSPGALRNNYGSWVGMQLNVGSTALNVVALGRIYLSGNTGSHVVKLVRASDGTDVPGGAVTLTPSTGTVGQFTFAQLASPVPLAANTSYYLVSQETANGDQWYDYTPVATTGAVTVPASVYWSGASWVPVQVPNTSYVPLNLKYQ